MSGAMSQGLWLQGYEGPRAVVVPLVAGVSSYHGWLQELGCHEDNVILLVGGAGSQDGWLRAPSCPRAGAVCWWVDWVLTWQAVELQLSWRWCPPTDG